MNYPMHISQDQVSDLQFEVVSVELRVYLTRLLEDRLVPEGSPEPIIYRQNIFVNKARAMAGLDQFVLPPDDGVIFEPSVQVWHAGEFQVALRRLDTPRFVDFLADLIQDELFEIDEINELLGRDGVSFRYHLQGEQLYVEVFPIDQIEAEAHTDEHPNIRLLIDRMDRSFSNGDYSGVLHASASVFETMAKDVIGAESIQDQSLGSFFQKYRNESLLPDEILNFILDTYNARGKSPLAGHGSTNPPEISEEQAIILSEMTKAFVRIEYWLHQVRLSPGDA